MEPFENFKTHLYSAAAGEKFGYNFPLFCGLGLIIPNYDIPLLPVR